MKTLFNLPLNALLLCTALTTTAASVPNDKGEQIQEKTFGTKRHGKLIHFADGMFRDNTDRIEIGQVIKLKKKTVQVQTVKLYVFDTAVDSLDFKISFYQVINGQPTLTQIHEPIWLTQAIDEGWLTLDLSNYDLVLDKDFLVALETEKTSKYDESLSYEVKPLANRNSYYRFHHSDTWKRPPHRYCLQVVANVL
ncbi:hypothetical protein BFP72_10305 [Reichenbachiella sp. 5M10]|uniref:hypothetical protein n=1 Tax=Reichenbachiella sp. 5M10 TaxID=1889772 RepID=UPI000C161F17|nr:hypothetical protein [Reichenbachiella sp. 5M10]PIB35757.1 hypothetical protein BFP72_10305 [Reichenbachiella sp. 5M10]